MAKKLMAVIVSYVTNSEFHLSSKSFIYPLYSLHCTGNVDELTFILLLFCIS